MKPKHYEVISPDITYYYYDQPPDTGPCYGAFFAKNQRDAAIAAIKDPKFKPWVDEARSDTINPFKGLKVQLARCEHGICHICEECNTCTYGDDLYWLGPSTPGKDCEEGNEDLW